MKDTVVIHPPDWSTDFLKDSYMDLGFDILMPWMVSRKAITKYKRVIMLGHGDPSGLHGGDQYLIDKKLSHVLRSRECVGIWCHANKFAKTYGLKGYFTGMVISEYGEAVDYCVPATTSEIEKSNVALALALKEYFRGAITSKQIGDTYVNICGESPVSDFNYNSLLWQE